MGKLLYETYQKVFGAYFSPKWAGLSEESRAGWERVATEFEVNAALFL